MLSATDMSVLFGIYVGVGFQVEVEVGEGGFCGGVVK